MSLCAVCRRAGGLQGGGAAGRGAREAGCGFRLELGSGLNGFAHPPLADLSGARARGLAMSFRTLVIVPAGKPALPAVLPLRKLYLSCSIALPSLCRHAGELPTVLGTCRTGRRSLCHLPHGTAQPPTHGSLTATHWLSRLKCSGCKVLLKALANLICAHSSHSHRHRWMLCSTGCLGQLWRRVCCRWHPPHGPLPTHACAGRHLPWHCGTPDMH